MAFAVHPDEDFLEPFKDISANVADRSRFSPHAVVRFLAAPSYQVHFAGLQKNAFACKDPVTPIRFPHGRVLPYAHFGFLCCFAANQSQMRHAKINLTSDVARVQLPPSGDRSAHEEAPMIFLMVECPSTGQIISTGINDGIDRLPKVGTRTQCPLCGQEHFWTSREVRFAESPSGKRKLTHKYQRFESSLA
jgi:hypothetical protein